MEGGRKLETKYTLLSTKMVSYVAVRKVREKVKVNVSQIIGGFLK